MPRERKPSFRAPARFAPYLFGAIQSGLTCLVASGIACAPMLGEGHFLAHWLSAWLIAWVTMLPIVILAAPLIQKLVRRITGN